MVQPLESQTAGSRCGGVLTGPLRGSHLTAQVPNPERESPGRSPSQRALRNLPTNVDESQSRPRQQCQIVIKLRIGVIVRRWNSNSNTTFEIQSHGDDHGNLTTQHASNKLSGPKPTDFPVFIFMSTILQRMGICHRPSSSPQLLLPEPQKS